MATKTTNAKTTTATPAAKAPARAGAAKPAAKAAPAPAPTVSALRERFQLAWQQADKESIQQGYTNTQQGSGGQSWEPEPDDYVFRILEGGDVEVFESKKNKGEFNTIFRLPVEIVGATEHQDLIGTQFDVPFWLNPRKDEKTGDLKVYDAGTLKSISEKLFGSEIEDVEECCIRIAEEGVGSAFDVSVVARKKGNGINYYWNDKVEE